MPYYDFTFKEYNQEIGLFFSKCINELKIVNEKYCKAFYIQNCELAPDRFIGNYDLVFNKIQTNIINDVIAITEDPEYNPDKTLIDFSFGVIMNYDKKPILMIESYIYNKKLVNNEGGRLIFRSQYILKYGENNYFWIGDDKDKD